MAELATVAQSVGPDVQLSGFHSHNALGAGERYHAPLLHIFLKII